MRLSADEARRRFLAEPVARLATIKADGSPRLVPVVFAYVDGAIVHAVDHKPKSTPDLARLRDIAGDPRVTFLADAYDRDWSRLWWARADAVARVLDPVADPDEWRTAVEALVDRYPQQYRETRPSGSVVAAQVIRWTGWSASEG